MWNEKLKKIDPINTPKNFVQLWRGEIDSIKLISEGINYVYRFEREGQRCFLRVSHADLRSQKEILAAISFQLHLISYQVPVCRSIKSQQENWVEIIDQQGEKFIAHVCQEVPGYEMCYDLKNSTMYFEWGWALGKFHEASTNYDPKKLDYASWDKSFDEMEEYAKLESTEIQHLLNKLKKHYFQKEKNRNKFGLTHGDHREANVLTDGQQVSFIDFDLPCWNWFQEDLIRPFFNGVIDDNPQWKDCFPNYLEGYFSVRPRESIDLEHIAKQIQLKGLEIYLWTKHNWSGDVAPGGADTKGWLSRIYNKLITDNWIKDVEAVIKQYLKERK